MALAGLRLGEALGLKWPSVDQASKRLDIHEQILSDSTKTGESRRVDMADALALCLSALEAQRRKKAFAQGEPMSPWVVFPWLGEQPDAKDQQAAEKIVRRAMERVLKVAHLPRHFTPHSLRHTFCSLLIGDSVSPVYVQQQAGHASVEMTVGVYGSWFAPEAHGAMNRLAGGLPVTKQAEPVTSESLPSEQVLASTGTYGQAVITRPSPARSRTARASCRGSSAACRSTGPSPRCSSGSRAACRPGRTVRPTP